nr:hypothetical protein HK105_003519 [Polyrhizophydium stewartii]
MTVNGSPVRIWDSTSEETEILDRQELGPASYRSFKFNPRLQLMAGEFFSICIHVQAAMAWVSQAWLVGSDSGVVVLWQSTIASKPGAKTRIWEVGIAHRVAILKVSRD